MSWPRCVQALSACLALWLASSQAALCGQSGGPQSNQTPRLIPRTHEEREARFRAQHRIVLNVEVTDAGGNAVTGLNAGDFVLTQDRQPRSIASFRQVNGEAAPVPPQVMLVLDAVNNSSRDLANDRKGIENFLRQSSAPLAYPTSIAVLSGAEIKSGTPTRDRSVLRYQLNELTAGLRPVVCADEANADKVPMTVWIPGGPVSQADPTKELNCLNQRFITSINALTQFAKLQIDIPGRIILVWMGAGWPLLNNKQFTPDDASVKAGFFENLVQVSSALREAQMTLDVVLPSSLFRTPESRDQHEDAYFNGVPNQDEVTAASLGLQALAHQSGGQILIGARNIPGGVAACMADAKSYYELTFDSPPAAQFGEYHSLQVKVEKPGVTVRTNTVYYAEQ
ncbi:MAG TPA: VWA domain-containing protein [Terracidiphilus sp.]